MLGGSEDVDNDDHATDNGDIKLSFKAIIVKHLL